VLRGTPGDNQHFIPVMFECYAKHTRVLFIVQKYDQWKQLKSREFMWTLKHVAKVLCLVLNLVRMFAKILIALNDKNGCVAAKVILSSSLQKLTEENQFSIAQWFS